MTESTPPVIAPISRSRHAGRKWRPYTNYEFARSRIVVPLVAAEVPVSAGSFPVVFVPDGDAWQPVALLGLEAGRNLLLDPGGLWMADYVPALLRVHPFVLGRSPDGQAVLCVDESALPETGQDGEPLVLEDGGLPDRVKKVGEFLAQLEAQRRLTVAACTELARKKCLKPVAMGKDVSAGPSGPAGVQQVDEKALASLSDADFLDLRKSGALALAYGQLASLHRLPLLARLKSRQAQQQADLSLLERDGTLRFDVLS